MFGMSFGELISAGVGGVFLLVITVSLLKSCFFIVRPKEGCFVTFFGGSIQRVITEQGLYLKLPWPIQQRTQTYDLSMLKFCNSTRVKSSNGVFFDLEVAAFIRRNPDALEASVFNVDNINGLIAALISESVKTSVTAMSVSDVYSDRDSLQNSIRTALEEIVKNGWIIDRIVVDDPELDKATQDASNRVYIAEREKEAAVSESATIFEHATGEARANAESLRLRTEAIGTSKTLTATSTAEAINAFSDTLDPEVDIPVELFVAHLEKINWSDALIQASSNEGSVIVFAEQTKEMDANIIGQQVTA